MTDQPTFDTITPAEFTALQLKAARMEHAVAEYAKLRVKLEDTEARAEAASRLGTGYMVAAEKAEAAIARVHEAVDKLCREPHPGHDHVCPDDVRKAVLGALAEPKEG